MTTQVSSILDSAGRLLNDVRAVRWTKSELLSWLNDGQIALVKIKDAANTVSKTVRLAAGATQTLPADCYKLLDVVDNLSGAVVTPCDKSALDSFLPKWRIAPTSNSVIHHIPSINPSEFFVYPAQNATPAELTLTYVAYPALVTETDSLKVRDEFAANILNYVLYRAYSKDAEVAQNAALAASYFALFKE